MSRHFFQMVCVIAMLCSMFFVFPAFAGEEAFMAEIRILKEKIMEIDDLKARVAELETKLEEQKCALIEERSTVKEVKEALIQYRPGEGITVEPCGLEITAGATFVLQGTPNANNAGESEASRFDAAWSSDIFIQRAFGDWALALVHLEPGQGDTVEPELSLYSNVNRDTNDTDANVPVTELWYEHYLFDKQIVLTAGKMDPANYLDQNEYAHDETTQFLGRVFKMNPAIEWPDDNTLGARFVIAPKSMPFLSLEGAYFDADNDWENVFDRPFASTQLNMRLWDGNYRLYSWINARDHAKLVGQDEAASDETKRMNAGFGLSCDQKLGDVFGLFGRFGWQRPDLALVSANPNASPVESSWSGGLQMTGKYWTRPDDVLACGVGQLFPSRRYKEAGNGGAAEGHLEIYYKFQAFENLAFTPDLQVLWNPRGVNHDYLGDEDTVFVYGIRGQIDL